MKALLQYQYKGGIISVTLKIMGINIIICDEDRIGLKITTTYIEEFSQKYKVNTEITTYSTTDENFFNYIANNTIDIAFLDIHYKNHDGLMIAQEIQKRSPWVSLVFITESSEYAMDAFRILALGFLEKPTSQHLLEKVFIRAVVQAQSMRYRKIGSSINFVSNKASVCIRQQSIIYLEKLQQKTKIITKQRNYETYETLSSIETRLDSTFLRINQSIIVNMLLISTFEQSCIVLRTGQTFKIGRTYLKKVKEAYADCPSALIL